MTHEQALGSLLSAAAPPPAAFTAFLTDEQLESLSRCAKGVSLRFEASNIVDALVAGGYVVEGVGRVVTVTAKGHEYLRTHAVDKAQVAVLVGKLVAIPDKLVTVKSYLHPLSCDDALDRAEAKQTIADACCLLHSAIADVMEVVRDLAGPAALDAKRSIYTHVGADTRYRPAP